MPKVKIRHASPRDLPRILQIQEAALMQVLPNTDFGISEEDVRGYLKSQTTPEMIRSRREEIRHPGKGVHFFVGEWEEGITTILVGYCQIQVYPMYNALHGLYVHRDYQGKGVGTALWKMACRKFNNALPTLLGVARYNTRAIIWYEQLRFKIYRTHPVGLMLRLGKLVPVYEMVRDPKKENPNEAKRDGTEPARNAGSSFYTVLCRYL